MWVETCLHTLCALDALTGDVEWMVSFQPQTNAPGNGSRDAAVGQLQFGIVDLGAIALNDTLELLHRGYLRV